MNKKMFNLEKMTTREDSVKLALVLLFASVLLTGCATSPISRGTHTKSVVVDYPAVGTLITAGLGERLVAKGMRTTGPTLTITGPTTFNKKPGEASIMTCAITVNATRVFKIGEYRSEGTTADCYGPVTGQVTNEDGSTNLNCMGQTVQYDVCRRPDGSIFLSYLIAKIPLEQDFDNLQFGEGVVERESNFIQELIYNGRVGNSLRFVYREFSDNIVRPAFTQEVQYDYSESKIVGFKDLRMEIESATNTSIQYRLLSNFQ